MKPNCLCVDVMTVNQASEQGESSHSTTLYHIFTPNATKFLFCCVRYFNTASQFQLPFVPLFLKPASLSPNFRPVISDLTLQHGEKWKKYSEFKNSSLHFSNF